jgi:hypothetical protein
MCTITILPGAALTSDPPEPRPLPHLRVVFTRDERLSRGRALPPRVHAIAGRRVLMPTDADAGGTWVAVNDAGLVFGLLNVNEVTSPSRAIAAGGLRSRGLIIPALARWTRLAEVVKAVRTIEATRHAPFRLLAVSDSAIVEAISDGVRLRVRHRPLPRPLMRTSSSLGDASVAGPRRARFSRLPRRLPVARGVQDAFHRHRSPQRPHLGVLMSRADARSVSITTIEVSAGRATMRYEPLGRAGDSCQPESAPDRELTPASTARWG